MAQQEATFVSRSGNDVAETATAAIATARIQLWDLPIRVFHWSLVAAVTTAIVTGKLGGSWIELHGKAGIVVVGLIAFRLVWGLVGSTSARFVHFAPTPGKILDYIKGKWRGIGHNPLGALSVFALLGLLSFQAGTGLVSNDDISFAGPLAQLIDDELSHSATNWHHQASNLLFVLLGLHVAAIGFYTRIKKEKLVRPMVTGWKDVSADLAAPRQAGRMALLIAIVVALGAAYGASGAWIKLNTTPSPHAEGDANQPEPSPAPSPKGDDSVTAPSKAPAW